jgi:hypothetical protein
MKFREFESVLATVNFPKYKVKQGDSGAIVDVWTNGKFYEVEFFRDGETIAVVTVTPEQIERSITPTTPKKTRPFSTAKLRNGRAVK